MLYETPTLARAIRSLGTGTKFDLDLRELYVNSERGPKESSFSREYFLKTSTDPFRKNSPKLVDNDNGFLYPSRQFLKSFFLRVVLNPLGRFDIASFMSLTGV